jgi:putative transposase
MKTKTNCYHRYRFAPAIINHALWQNHRFCLSFRDIEELLAKRGIIVSYETIRQWYRKFGPEYARNFKRRQGRLGDVSTSWFSEIATPALPNGSFPSC